MNKGQTYNRTEQKALVKDINRMETSYKYHDAKVEKGLNLITPSKKAAKTTVKYYTNKKGDTWSHIAARNKISLKSLLNANPGINPRKLQIGQKVNLL